MKAELEAIAAKIWRMELERAVYHEVGHTIVARHFGLQAYPYVWRNDSGVPSEKAWLGTCDLLGTRTPFRMAVIGWAGIASEWYTFDGMDHPAHIWEDAQYRDYELSTTDIAAMYGHPQSYRACKCALSLVQKYADDIRAMAGEMIARA